MNTSQKIIVLLPATIIIALFCYFVFEMKGDMKSEAVKVEESQKDNVQVVEEPVNNIQSSNTAITNGEDKNQAVSSVPVEQTLVVSPTRCIGCGKCARVDSQHFKLVGGVSTVISQENLDSSNLKSAINICPVDAISLS